MKIDRNRQEVKIENWNLIKIVHVLIVVKVVKLYTVPNPMHVVAIKFTIGVQCTIVVVETCVFGWVLCEFSYLVFETKAIVVSLRLALIGADMCRWPHCAQYTLYTVPNSYALAFHIAHSMDGIHWVESGTMWTK